MKKHDKPGRGGEEQEQGQRRLKRVREAIMETKKKYPEATVALDYLWNLIT